MDLEADTLDMIKSSLEMISKHRSNPSREAKVLRRIRKIKHSQNPDICLYSAQWIIQYHTEAFSNCENTKQVNAVMKSAESDLSHALDLLEMNFKDKKQKMQALVLSADIAQKLSKFDKLSDLYTELIVHSKTNPEFNFMALSISPSMGDWKHFYQFCKDMEKEYNNYSQRMSAGQNPPNIVEALHQLAESGMPDLGIIYHYVKEKELYKLPRSDPAGLFEHTVNIDSVDLELIKIVAEDEKRKQEIREEYEKEKENEFKLDELAIAVNGGLVLFPGLSREVGLMLVGPYYDPNLIDVEGYTDLQMSELDENGNPKMGFNTPEFTNEVLKAMPQEILEAIQSGELPPSALFEAMGMVNSMANNSDENVNTPPKPNSAGTETAHHETAQPAQGLGDRGQAELLKNFTSKNGKQVDLHESFLQFAKNFEERRPEMLARFGQTMVRQQERICLKRVEGGYEGKYIVRNYHPLTKQDETSMELKISLKCAHLRDPAPTINLSNIDEDMGKIASGIDNLELE